MSEHGWPDFHDDGLHHDDGAHHDDLPLHDEQSHDAGLTDDTYFDDAHHDDALPGHDLPGTHETADTHETWQQGHEPEPAHDGDEQDEPHELRTVGADPDALPEPDAAETAGVFPPVLDVGPLPEPVDGFPWIDTGSLGLVDPASVHAAASIPVNPEDLAAYAGTDLPPGVDPWAALADSDDPATSALAKWWSEHQS